MLKSTKPATDQTVADLEALMSRHETALFCALQKIARFDDDEQGAKLSGPKALLALRQAKLEVEAERDSAQANKDELTPLLAAARCREEKQRAVDDKTALQAELPAALERYRRNWYECVNLVRENKALGQAMESRIDDVNKRLPSDVAPIEPFEAPWRHSPAVPDRTEMRDVERYKQGGVIIAGRIGDQPATEIVQVPVKVPGSRAYRPEPLYKTIEIPNLGELTAQGSIKS